MEDNKYYTPDIESFHVGFEYEIKNSSNLKLFEWEKQIVKDLWNLNFYPSDLKENNIRVKYLDKEDIESLGYKFISEDLMEQRFIFKDKSVHCKYLSFMTGRKDELNNTVTIHSSNNSETYGKIVFEGIINNKSKLKELLNKQLNIIK